MVCMESRLPERPVAGNTAGMHRQSRLSVPTLLLTRPAAQNRRFAKQMIAHFGTDLKIIESPLLAPRFLEAPLPAQSVRAVVFTSETGVEGLRRLAAETDVPAWCVGARTAVAANAAGFHSLDGGGDARTMVDRIIAAKVRGPLLVARGEDQAVDVAKLLKSAGIETVEAVVYAQDLQPLTSAARALLAGDSTVVAPLFSVRTAAHFSLLPEIQKRRCGLWIACLSDAVLQAAAPARAERAVVAARPDADALIAAVEEWYGTAGQP